MSAWDFPHSPVTLNRERVNGACALGWTSDTSRVYFLSPPCVRLGLAETVAGYEAGFKKWSSRSSRAIQVFKG